MFCFWLLSFLLTARFPSTVQYFITLGFISQCLSAVLRAHLTCPDSSSVIGDQALEAMHNLYPLFYYIMAVLLVNSNFVITGYIMPFILFLSTWFMVAKQFNAFSSETTMVLMAFFTKILAFLLIGYYRMHKDFVQLFISQFESKRREEELQFMMDQQDHGVMVLHANRKYSQSRLVFNNKSAAAMINQADFTDSIESPVKADGDESQNLLRKEVFEFHCEADFVQKDAEAPTTKYNI